MSGGRWTTEKVANLSINWESKVGACHYLGQCVTVATGGSTSWNNEDMWTVYFQTLLHFCNFNSNIL